jgi:hypothetical protein
MCLSVLVVHLLIILLTQTNHCACIYAVLPQVLVCMPTSHVLRTLVRRLFDRLCSRAEPLYSHACIVKTITPIDCDASGFANAMWGWRCGFLTNLFHALFLFLAPALVRGMASFSIVNRMDSSWPCVD